MHSEEGSRIYAKRKVDVEPVFGRLKRVFGVRRVHVRGHQAVQTEIGFLFMSMKLTKLAKKLAAKIAKNQKPHDDSCILIVFKTEITVWFYFEAGFCPGSKYRLIQITNCIERPETEHDLADDVVSGKGAHLTAVFGNNPVIP